MISSLTLVHRLVKLEKFWGEALRGLYGYFSLMDIMYLKMMSVLTHQVSWIRGLTMPTSSSQGSLLGLSQVGLRSLIKGLITRLAFLQGSTLGLGAPLCWHPPEVQWPRCKAAIRRAFERSALVSSFSSTFSSSFSSSFRFFLFFFLLHLPFFFSN